MKLTVKPFLFAMTALLVSCSADDNDLRVGRGANDVDNESLLPIKLAVGDIPATRASDGLLAENFPSETGVTLVIDGNEYSYKTNEPGQTMTCTSTTAPFYPIDGKSVSIKAFYPPTGDGWYNRTTIWNWGVSADQSSDANYKSSDKMYATVPSSYSGLDADGKVTPTKDIVPLMFYHLMAKVKLTITTPDANTKIYKVTLNSVKTKYKMDCVNCLAYDAYFDTNNTAGVITVYNNANGATGTVTCAAVFPPQTIGTDVNFITVTTTDGTLYYKLPQSVNFTSGQQYTYTLSTYVDKSGYKVGNVICSDGTFCEYSKVGSKTPVAVVVYVGSNTANDKFKKGIAMSLSDAWYGNIHWVSNGASKLYNPIQCQYINSIEDGYSYFKSPWIDEIRSGSLYFGAFHAAYVFNNVSKYKDLVSKGLSGFFLGSSYQWYQVLQSLGGYNNAEAYNKLNNLFTSVGGKALSGYYWTCSEVDGNFAFAVESSSHKFVTTLKTNACEVRPILLF